MSALSVQDVTVERSGLPIVRDATLEVDHGSVTVLLGANGAGKTTLLEGISGMIPIAAGEVTLDGERIDGWRPFRRARAGLAHVEQGRSVFPELTVEENIAVASDNAQLSEVYALFPELEKRRTVAAARISGGEQQMLVIARALVRRPTVLLLDEMSLGLAPIVVGRLAGAVRTLSEGGLAILMVEQFAALAIEVGNRAYVLRGGEIVFNGSCDDLRAAPSLLQELYLGESTPSVAGSER